MNEFTIHSFWSKNISRNKLEEEFFDLVENHKSEVFDWIRDGNIQYSWKLAFTQKDAIHAYGESYILWKTSIVYEHEDDAFMHRLRW